MAPRLVFVPSLGSTTKVPLGHSCSATVTFKIYVTVYREWWNKFRGEGRRIEVWSDLPGGGRHPGEWGETAFVEQNTPAHKRDVLTAEALDDPNAIQVSLLSPEEQTIMLSAPEPFSNDRKVTLVAPFTLPQKFSHYSYTFRLAGPGSRTEWLGTMGSNGVVIVGESGHRSGFEEQGAGSWTSVGSSARKWSREQSDGKEAVEIGQFKKVDMVGWAFGKQGYSDKVVPNQTTSPANFFLLHPRHDALIASRPFTDPPASITISSSDNTTYITDDGKLMTYADSVAMQDFYPFTLPHEIHTSTSQEWEALDVPDSPVGEFVFFKSISPVATNGLLPSSVPTGLAALPSVASDTLPPHSLLSLPLTTLLQIQPSQPGNMLYSPSNDSVTHVDFRAPELETKSQLSFLIGRDGGEITVIPAFQIGAGAAEEDKDADDLWDISVLEPALASVAVEHDAPGLKSAIPETVEEEAKPVEEAEEGDVVQLSTPKVEAESLPTATEDVPGEFSELSTPVPTSESSATTQPGSSSVLRGTFDHAGLLFLKAILMYLNMLLSFWTIFTSAKPVATAPVANEDKDYEEITQTAVDTAEEAASKDDFVVVEQEKEASESQSTTTEEPVHVEAPTPEPTEQEHAEPEPVPMVEEKKPETPRMMPSKLILTPPMTPPRLPSEVQVNRLGLTSMIDTENISPIGINTIDPHSTKTKLVFRLPLAADHFKLILHHVTESEPDPARIKVLVDKMEIPQDDEARWAIRRVGEADWIVQVDAKDKTTGRVEVCVV